MKEAVTRLVFSIGDKPQAPLFLDNLRLERDTETAKVLFDGLWAFDVGPAGSPGHGGLHAARSRQEPTPRAAATAGRTPISGGPSTRSSPIRSISDFICVENGGLALDVPNGKYHVFVNMDSPSGFWGEFQRYRKRALILNGVRHEDTMDLESFKKRYYRSLGQGRPALGKYVRQVSDPVFPGKAIRRGGRATAS